MNKNTLRPVSLPPDNIPIKPNKFLKRKEVQKDFPFTAEHFLEAVDEAAKRSRGLLLILIFTSIIILMALVNSLSPDWSWYSSKVQLYEDISQHVYFSVDSTGIPPKKWIKFEDLVKDNEKKFRKQGEHDSEKQQKVDILLKRYEKFEKVLLIYPTEASIFWDTSFVTRHKIYDRLGKAIQYIYINHISDKEVIDKYIDKLYAAKVEHIELVRVPILGVTFHVNFLGVFSGLTLIVLYALFYFNLRREHINTKIAFRRGWRNAENYHHHYYYYEYLSMFQILSNPKRLFVKRKRTISGYSVFSSAAMYFPLFVYSMLVAYDWNSSWIGHEINDRLTNFTLYFGLFFWVLILLLSILVHLFWRRMDRIWDYQALEFNFECILEKSGIDKDVDLHEYTTCTLTIDDGPHVKAFWYNTLKEFFKSAKRLDERTCFRMYLGFLNQLLEKDGIIKNKIVIDKAKTTLSTEELEIYWSGLYNWYSTFGKRAVTSRFRQEFVKAIEALQEKYNESATIATPPQNQ